MAVPGSLFQYQNRTQPEAFFPQAAPVPPLSWLGHAPPQVTARRNASPALRGWFALPPDPIPTPVPPVSWFAPLSEPVRRADANRFLGHFYRAFLNIVSEPPVEVPVSAYAAPALLMPGGGPAAAPGTYGVTAADPLTVPGDTLSLTDILGNNLLDPYAGRKIDVPAIPPGVSPEVARWLAGVVAAFNAAHRESQRDWQRLSDAIKRGYIPIKTPTSRPIDDIRYDGLTHKIQVHYVDSPPGVWTDKVAFTAGCGSS